jgi:hypothetical protein
VASEERDGQEREMGRERGVKGKCCEVDTPIYH